MDSWDVFKENIQPISQGRKISALMDSLTITDDKGKVKEKFKLRKEQFDGDLIASQDDPSRQLNIWHDYIDWLEQNVPDGGKVNGITEAIEKCIELYYDKKEFKQDKRLFDIFMKFKRFCDEPLEVFGFMYANSICSLLARFYLNWSWQYEMRKNMKRAEDLIKLGLKNLASPREVLVEAEAQLKCRINRMLRAGDLDDMPPAGPESLSTRETQDELASGGIRAALQTLKFRVTKKKGIRVPVRRIGSAVDQVNVGGLKSQTMVVNGVRVPKKVATRGATAGPTSGAKVTSAVSKLNKPIEVYVDQSVENMNEAENINEATSAGKLADLSSIKRPTSQRIRMVGRSGKENHMASSGTLSLASASNVPPPPIPEE